VVPRALRAEANARRARPTKGARFAGEGGSLTADRPRFIRERRPPGWRDFRVAINEDADLAGARTVS